MIELININEIKPNKDNPRVIKNDKYKKLVQSIREFPEMLKLRPIVIDNDGVVIGGNMRLKACKEIGMQEVYIIRAFNLTDEQKKEFIIKDNVGFGEWDFDILANEWDNDKLIEWGMDVPSFEETNLDDFFETENETEPEEEKFKIILEYNENDYNIVKSALLKHGKSCEDAVFKLLGL